MTPITAPSAPSHGQSPDAVISRRMICECPEHTRTTDTRRSCSGQSFTAEGLGHRRLKVLHVSTVHQPYDTRIFRKEVLSLAQSGYEVALAVNVEENEIKDGVRFIPLGKYGGARWRRMSRNLRAVRSMLARGVDIVHFHDPELLITVIPALLAGRRIIYDIHEYYFDRIVDSEWIWHPVRSAVAKLYVTLERILVPHFAGLVVVTEKMEQEYRQRFPGLPVALVQNFPSISDSDKAQARNQSRPLSEDYVVHLGGASRAKCFDVMVAAAERLRADGVNAAIINLGPVDLSTFSRAERRNLLERAEAADVRLLGVAEYSEMLRWVAHARVGYMLRRDLPDARFALSTKLFEYFAMGIPVVATSEGLPGQLVNKYKAGIVVPPTDAEAHAAALSRLLTDDAFAFTVAEASSKAGQYFRFDAERERLLQLYDTIARLAWRDPESYRDSDDRRKGSESEKTNGKGVILRILSPFAGTRNGSPILDNTRRMARIADRFTYYRRVGRGALGLIPLAAMLRSHFTWLLPQAPNPAFIAIEFTNYCNLRCSYCTSPLGLRTRGFMSAEAFERLLQQIQELRIPRVRIVGNGESTLHPQFSSMVKALAKSCRYVQVVTNGSHLTEPICDAILSAPVRLLEISADSDNKAGYERSRIGSKFEELIENLVRLREIRERTAAPTLINVRAMLRPSEVPRREHILQFWQQYADTVYCQYVHDYTKGNEPDVFAHRHDQGLIPRCTFLSKGMIVHWNGKVPICELSQRQTGMADGLIVGDVFSSTLAEIWRSQTFEEYRRGHRERRAELTLICRGCIGY